MGWFITFIYQPLFNLLVGIYWLLEQTVPQHADMGNAVIIFTVFFRILWLPITWSSSRTAREEYEIGEKVKKIQQEFKTNPIREKEEMKKVLRNNRRIVVMSAINIFFQVMVMLMLYRIFTTGLEGADFNLIYKWMPPHPEQFNLTWLNGRFDLAHPNWTLNWINSGALFVMELMASWMSPFPTGRAELMSLIVLPLGAFTFFAFMPAGKKLFVITTLLISIGIMLAKALKILYYESRGRLKKVAYSLILDKPTKEN